MSEDSHFTTALGGSRNGRSWDKVLHGESPVPILRVLGSLNVVYLVRSPNCADKREEVGSVQECTKSSATWQGMKQLAWQ